MAIASKITKEDMLARVAELAPMIKARAAETEQLGKAHPEVVESLVANGFLRIVTPEMFGGYALDFDTAHEVSLQLGRVCGSTSWNFAVWAIHPGMIAKFPMETQQEFWAGGPDPICSASFGLGTGVEKASVQRVPGGFRISGHWRYASGCDYSQWLLLGLLAAAVEGDGRLPNGDQPVAPGDPRSTPNEGYLALVPTREVRIADNWEVSGLRGSGSKDIVTDDLFVPAHRVVKFPRGGEDSIGWTTHRMLSHRATNSGFALSAPVFGMAWGIVDEFAAAPGRGVTQVTQYHLAESAAEVDATVLLMQRDHKMVLDKAAAGEQLTPLEAAQVGRDVQFGLKLSMQAANRLYESTGAHVLLLSEPMQRLHRDAHAGAKRSRASMIEYGKSLMGM